MVSLPRVMVAAPSTGQGKTTIATGLMAALHATGHAVSGHKVGPDYIDPGYHELATGRPGRNLDPHLVGEKRVTPLLLHGARGADVAVIEGAMGLHDGRIGTDGFASSAHVAGLTRTPVVLVVDISRQSRSAGAIVAGVATFDPAVEVVGVILNQAGSARNLAEVERSLPLPVLGVVARDDRLAAPSRHLGLVPAAEREKSARTVAAVGEQLARSVDLTAVLDVARSAPDLDAEPWDPTGEVTMPSTERPVVAVAAGRAFTFRYAETAELLTAAGCDVVGFDPLADPALPAGTSGIYLGGGFPEMYAGELAANRSLMRDLRTAVGGGVPTVAECAGLLHLTEALDGVPMTGVVPATAEMTSRLTLRYPIATAAGDTLLTRVGEEVTGHEFHRTTTTPPASPTPAWVIDGEPSGFAGPTLHASYLHVHWAGHPHLTQRFADAVRSHAGARGNGTRPVPARAWAAPALLAAPEPVRDPLRHHGDVEASPGLLDFAVNVFAEPRPPWLDSALHDSIDASGAYPDAEPARAAIAQRHGRRRDEVLSVAGAAEAFSLVARLRQWRRPVVVHPQFTEPHAALEQAGHQVTTVLCRPEDDFLLDPATVPDDADLVVVGNPTNPTGRLHPAETLRGLCRPGRVVVVDEAFMDAVPGEPETLVHERRRGLAVIRSLTKHWSVPGVRAGYVVGDAAVVGQLARGQVPWSVSASAIAATVACTTRAAAEESRIRAQKVVRWRTFLEGELRRRGVITVPSSAPFVLARLGEGAYPALREHGVALRRADTFPGLDAAWARIAVRRPDATLRLLTALDAVLTTLDA